MTELEKLFKNIQNQSNNEKIKHKRLKICKYSFEISKVAILSVATGLSFISIFAILSMILIPIIDSIKHNSNIDIRLNITKLKKTYYLFVQERKIVQISFYHIVILKCQKH